MVIINSFVKSFRTVPQNAKINIYLLPLWGVPFNLINSYASLYMINQGISSEQVGMINSTSLIVNTIIAFFAGYVVNRLGRKYSVGILDMVGWALPMFIYSFATSYIHFFIAALINCITVINGIANQCYFIEDVELKDRITVFNSCSLFINLCGFVVPISGYIISQLGLITAMRRLYFFAGVIMIIAAIFKLIFLKETTVGKMMKNQKFQGNLFASFKRSLLYIFNHRILIVLLAINILLNFTIVIMGLYYFPYLTNRLNFTESIVSVFPFITTAISLLVYFFLVPQIKNLVLTLKVGIAVYTFGALTLISAPLFSIWGGVLISVLCSAMANAVMHPVLLSMIANNVEDNIRTEVMAFFNMLSTLLIFPVGYIGGILFGISEVYPFVLVFSLYLFSLILFMLVEKKLKA